MNLLMLSGNSKSNKAWIEEVQSNVKDIFEETKILYYDHWASGANLIEFENERKKLTDLVAGWNEYLIFAKSVGTLLSIAGIHDGALKPKAGLFCGFPRGFADQIHYQTIDTDWKSVTVPVILLQNENDPVGGYEEVKSYLEKLGIKVELIRTVGETHDYLDYDLIKEKLIELKG